MMQPRWSTMAGRRGRARGRGGGASGTSGTPPRTRTRRVVRGACAAASRSARARGGLALVARLQAQSHYRAAPRGCETYILSRSQETRCGSGAGAGARRGRTSGGWGRRAGGRGSRMLPCRGCALLPRRDFVGMRSGPRCWARRRARWCAGTEGSCSCSSGSARCRGSCASWCPQHPLLRKPHHHPMMGLGFLPTPSCRCRVATRAPD
mmetsp:Transcript_30074/g.58759  ORF Transcript_30074/g.58759 Transcript_30074/m.58759 type:complete len:208 (-) Transcript_30074:297-920(-)